MEFEKMSLEEIISLIKEEKTTAEEVYNYFLNRIKTIDPKIKSFVYVNEN
jgi:Asp-tRNA(Asn)/Glu-tRNA(Gln) amidotransferase A subunit family amidase